MSSACPTKKFHKTTYPSLDPARQELSAKGKTIIITGGGTGIGAETAKYFAKAGASRVAILGRREKPLLDTKAKLEAEYPGTEIIAIPTDATKENEVEAAFTKITAGGTTIDVLVSNAAVIGTMATINNMTTDEFLWGIIANLKANFNLTRTFLKYASKNAVVIESNSAAAHLILAPGISSYCVSKIATAYFYQHLAFEHPDLSVFAVQPGAIDTDMSREAGYKPKKEGEEFWFEGDGAELLASQDDVSLPASFYVWLASPEARFLRGKYLWANWDVDELKARAKEIQDGPLLSIGLVGMPFA